MGTAVRARPAVTDIVEHACSYDMAPSWLDGMNGAGRYTTRRGVPSQRGAPEHHPTLLEVAHTIGSWGHSMSDPLHGRCTGPRTKSRSRRPAIHQPLATKLKEDGVIDQAGLDALDAEIHADVEAAVKFCR